MDQVSLEGASSARRLLPDGRGMLYVVKPKRRSLEDAVREYLDAVEAALVARCATPPRWVDMVGGW